MAIVRWRSHKFVRMASIKQALMPLNRFKIYKSYIVNKSKLACKFIKFVYCLRSIGRKQTSQHVLRTPQNHVLWTYLKSMFYEHFKSMLYWQLQSMFYEHLKSIFYEHLKTSCMNIPKKHVLRTFYPFIPSGLFK